VGVVGRLERKLLGDAHPDHALVHPGKELGAPALPLGRAGQKVLQDRAVHKERALGKVRRRLDGRRLACTPRLQPLALSSLGLAHMGVWGLGLRI
jgi:hypothetical protein